MSAQPSVPVTGSAQKRLLLSLQSLPLSLGKSGLQRPILAFL